MLESISQSEELARILDDRMHNRKGGSNQRLAIMLGILTKDQHIKANLPEKDRSQFAMTRYKFLLEAPFEISNRCCDVMKKAPVHQFYKETGKCGMTAQMASESRLRTQQWLMHGGCNMFGLKTPVGNPMAFWTEQDVLLYVYKHNIPIASVYGQVVKDKEILGQMDLGDFGLFDDETPTLRTTGCQRTGCIFCGFGCQVEKGREGRFERLKHTHPKQYEYIMKPWDKGGLGYKEVIDWINEHGNLDIRY